MCFPCLALALGFLSRRSYPCLLQSGSGSRCAEQAHSKRQWLPLKVHSLQLSW